MKTVIHPVTDETCIAISSVADVEVLRGHSVKVPVLKHYTLLVETGSEAHSDGEVTAPSIPIAQEVPTGGAMWMPCTSSSCTSTSSHSLLTSDYQRGFLPQPKDLF
ncbi:hypothetical protein P7K49_010016 [Saguinus oedipus]|uniref:Uncharacterized protein n=1 Tax=Saguinus oedipus TaxID=9490 RepID=A0ABQ9VLK8_SAGOE|nr:hypothetical protein P7K49_010016 [Saguinus oedipus]